MEGLWKTWRHQTIINNSPDLDSYGKPLPPPPTGYYWSRLEDGSWRLDQFKETEHVQQTGTFQFPAVLEHVVMPSDTLQGICLKYRVSVVSLRQYNNFSGNAFRSKKALRIPIDAGKPICYQESTQEVLIQKFMNTTNELREEAKFYLEEHNFDLMEAVAAINGDTQWLMEHEQKMAPPSAPPAPAESEEVIKPAAIAYSIDEMNDCCPEEEGIMMPLLG